MTYRQCKAEIIRKDTNYVTYFKSPVIQCPIQIYGDEHHPDNYCCLHQENKADICDYKCSYYQCDYRDCTNIAHEVWYHNPYFEYDAIQSDGHSFNLCDSHYPLLLDFIYGSD